MNPLNRDLLVLFRQELMTPQALEHEIEFLHQLLYKIENLESLILAHEVFDLNKFKSVKNPALLRLLFRKKELKPFIFLLNKN